MAITQGSTTYFAYKKEGTTNTEETGAGGTKLRRVTGQLDLRKVEVTSAEKRTDFQEDNVTHGTRSVEWSLDGECFEGEYEEFTAAVLRRDFSAITTVSASSGDTFSISSGVLTRGAGGGESFITDGIAVGMIVNLTLMGSANNSRNFLVVAPVTATTLTLVAVDGGAAVADNSDASESATIVVPGKLSYIPATSHTSDTFTIERYDSATDTSHVGYGCKVGSMEVSITPDQAPSVSFSGLGIDRNTYETSAAPSLTSPAEAGTGDLMASAIGYIRINGSAVGVVTAASFSINTDASRVSPYGANTSPDTFYGRAAEVTGSLSILREGVTIENLFDDETEFELQLFQAAPGAEPRGFITYAFPRVKLNSADLDDPDGPTTITASFRAMRKRAATGYIPTTILIQDSSLS